MLRYAVFTRHGVVHAVQHRSQGQYSQGEAGLQASALLCCALRLDHCMQIYFLLEISSHSLYGFIDSLLGHQYR